MIKWILKAVLLPFVASFVVTRKICKRILRYDYRAKPIGGRSR